MTKKVKAAEVKKMNDFVPTLVKTEGFHKKADLADMAAEQGNKVPLYWQDPLYDSQLIMFPEYDLPEANKRYRHYYKFNPILSSCVDAHATFPLSDFQILCENEELSFQFYLSYLHNLPASQNDKLNSYLGHQQPELTIF